jgi:hypothetical protein
MKAFGCAKLRRMNKRQNFFERIKIYQKIFILTAIGSEKNALPQ